jgi:hypothetical protein
LGKNDPEGDILDENNQELVPATPDSAAQPAPQKAPDQATDAAQSNAAAETARAQAEAELAKAERIKAENEKAKQKARDDRRKENRKAVSGLPGAAKAAIVIIILLIIAAVVAYFAVIAPLNNDTEETQYLSETSLKEAVDVENLSTVDYTYKGIAEKTVTKLHFWSTTDRVKYEAHVRASFNMSTIEFTIDQDNHVVTAYLPDAQISDPTLDETKFGYLPESTSLSISEVIDICKQDAAAEIDRDAITQEATENLKNVIEALTLPFLGDEYTIEFKSLAEYSPTDDSNSEGVAGNQTESANTDDNSESAQEGAENEAE